MAFREEKGNAYYGMACVLCECEGHRWTGNESSEIWTMAEVYKNRNAITVFPNSAPVIEDFNNLPVESMLIGCPASISKQGHRVGADKALC